MQGWTEWFSLPWSYWPAFFQATYSLVLHRLPKASMDNIAASRDRSLWSRSLQMMQLHMCREVFGGGPSASLQTCDQESRRGLWDCLGWTCKMSRELTNWPLRSRMRNKAESSAIIFWWSKKIFTSSTSSCLKTKSISMRRAGLDG